MPDRIRLRETWDKTHQQKESSDQPEKELVTFLECHRPHLVDGAPVLDAGCGKGRNTLYLAQQGFTTVGCDWSPVAIKTARTRVRAAGVRVAFQVTDLTHLPYRNGRFAAVICIHVLPYHAKADISKVLHEFWRVLRPGGSLYVDLLDRRDSEYGCGPVLEPHTFLDEDEIPVHFVSRSEISELMQAFRLDRVAPAQLASHRRAAWVVWARRQGDEP